MVIEQISVMQDCARILVSLDSVCVQTFAEFIIKLNFRNGFEKEIEGGWGKCTRNCMRFEF